MAQRFVLRSLSLALSLGLLASLGLAACKKKSERESCNPEDYAFEKVTIALQAGPDINLDEEGNPLPTVVRIYLLSGDLATRSLEFTELWEDAQTVLGDEYISDKEFTLYPEKDELIELPVDAKATHILAVGIFRQPVGNTWYRVYEIPDTYGRQACDLKKQDKDPGTLGQPCMYLLLDRNQVDGGKNVPPGFDEDRVASTCTPLYSPPPPDDKAKK